MYNCTSGVHLFCTYAGKALPRNKTLEQLGFTESPELELREKSGKQLVSENVHQTVVYNSMMAYVHTYIHVIIHVQFLCCFLPRFHQSPRHNKSYH